MKKLLVFALAMAVSMGFGCAITNYSLITDNDVDGVVNTSGKAYVRFSGFFVATIWPDGNDNILNFVDQKVNGDRTLSTSNFFTTGTDSPFKDDLYCAADQGGCSVTTSDDPEVGDVDDYDYTFNTHCSGARSMSLLLSTSRYYGECGRAQVNDRSLRMVSLANEMTPVQFRGATWLRGNLSALNTSIVLDNRNGSIYSLPMTSQIGLTVNLAQHRLLVDMSNPNNRNLAQNAINWNNAHPGPGIHATLTVDGNDFRYNLKATQNASSWPTLHF